MTENDLEQMQAYGAQFAGDKIKVGDTVRYVPNDIIPIKNCTGKVTELYAHEFDDGTKVECAHVDFEQPAPIWKYGTALVNLEKVTERLPEADDLMVRQAELIKRLEAEIERLAVELDRKAGYIRRLETENNLLVKDRDEWKRIAEEAMNGSTP